MPNHPHARFPARSRALIAIAAAFLAISACSETGGDAADGSAESARGSSTQNRSTQDKGGEDARSVSNPSTTSLQDRAIERKGAITLRSDDVAKTRTEVVDAVENAGGYVADERSTTRDDGQLDRTRLQIVVPTGEFASTLDAVAGSGTVTSRKQSAEDVTDQVIDVNSRLENAKASLRRVRRLLDRADTLGQVIRLEGVMGKREADLESLQARHKSLETRTDTATIKVDVRLAADRGGTSNDEEDAGFMSGLAAGWSGLGEAWAVLATVLGAVLPFVLVLALPVAAVVVAVRRALRRRAATAT